MHDLLKLTSKLRKKITGQHSKTVLEELRRNLVCIMKTAIFSEKCGITFVDLFDKVARVSIESAVMEKIRLVLLQAPTCDMIRIRMPMKSVKSPF